jgi:hypothetical protein
VSGRADVFLGATPAPDLSMVGDQMGALRASRGLGGFGEGDPQPHRAMAGGAGPPLPPEELLPGQIPAHDTRWPTEGNTLMSGPTSAMNTSAPGVRHPEWS